VDNIASIIKSNSGAAFHGACTLSTTPPSLLLTKEGELTLLLRDLEAAAKSALKHVPTEIKINHDIESPRSVLHNTFVPRDIPLEAPLMPFIPEYIPAVSGPSRFLLVPPPNGEKEQDMNGIIFLHEQTHSFSAMPPRTCPPVMVDGLPCRCRKCTHPEEYPPTLDTKIDAVDDKTTKNKGTTKASKGTGDDEDNDDEEDDDEDQSADTETEVEQPSSEGNEPGRNITAIFTPMVGADAETELQTMYDADCDATRSVVCLCLNEQLEIPMDALMTIVGFAVEVTWEWKFKQVFQPHSKPLTNMAITKGGNKIASCSYDRCAAILGMQSADVELTLEGHKNVVYCVTFDDDEKYLFTASFDKKCKVFDLKYGELVHTLQGGTKEFVSMAHNPTTHMLAAGNMDNSVYVWNYESGKLVYKLAQHSAESITVCFCVKRDYLITASFDMTGRVWDMKDGACVHVLTHHKKEVSNGISTDDVCLLSSCDKTGSAWDLATGKLIYSMVGHEDEVLDIKIDPTERYVATGSADAQIIIWAYATGAILRRFVGHTGEIAHLNFYQLPNSALRLASVGQDTICHIWCVETGECIQRLEGHKDEIFSCVFAKESGYLCTASKDNTIRVYKPCMKTKR
jgi:dynein assembly factor with WDR repeat domains 1